MASIQCFLTGTALSWYIRLHDSYKQDWSAFVQAFKAQFSSQTNAQVEALTLVKKDYETVRHFALKFNNQLKGAGVMKMLLPSNENVMQFSKTEGLPRNLKLLQTQDK